MKILAVGDTHGDLEWVECDVIPHAVSNGCSTIMQLGDFGFVWDNDPSEAMRKVWRLEDMLRAAGIAMHFLPGNHENHPMLEHLAGRSAKRSPEGHRYLTPHVLYTGRISAWTWGGVHVAAVGGAVSVDRKHRVEGVSWWPEEQLSVDEIDAACHIGKVDVLFSHEAPVGIPMDLHPNLDSLASRASMTLIGRALEPTLWVHGHYHESLHYSQEHEHGATTVRGLACNRCTREASMLPVNLTAVTAKPPAAHAGGRA